jgi:hypothetical protein
MDANVRLFCVCVVLCIGIGLAKHVVYNVLLNRFKGLIVYGYVVAFKQNLKSVACKTDIRDSHYVTCASVFTGIRTLSVCL